MQKDIWQPRRIIEENYRKALKRLMDSFLEILSAAPITEPGQILDIIRQYTDTESFYDMGRAAASRMITGLYFDGANTWREAARQSMRGRAVFESLKREMQGPVGWKVQQLVDENAKLISTFPETISRQVAHFIEQESERGMRASSIADDLIRQFPDVTEGRINLIARTETSKASAALTRARAEDLGLDWFLWRTSKDARVRDSHRLMNMVLCSWNELPSPEALNGEKSVGYYGPGDIYNCRCYPQPLISVSDIAWPAKTYWAGQIRYVTRARFERITGGRMKEAA